MKKTTWPSEWLRGVLPLAILVIVAEGETYGYAIAQRLRQAGMGSVKGGTLYPILNRLEADGSLVSSWREGEAGPGRKFFAITESGKESLGSSRDAWKVFVERATALVNRKIDE